MGYYEAFLDDIDIALTDIAGISTTNSTRYISGDRWAKCINKNISNPFTKDVLTVGNSADDLTQYYDFFDLSRIPSDLKARPLYVHLDMSISGDKTGIAGIWITGKKDKVEENRPASKDLKYRLAFNTSIKAPKGHQISFEKNRQFVFWLREQGFNVKGVSTDTFQSYDTGQTLKVKGFNYDIVSVDKVDKDRINKPYQYFKTTVYDERIEIYQTALLTEEIIGLKRDNNGKIDHDITGINSKDSADAVCGAVYNASQRAEEFSFDFGESLDVIVSTNNGGDYNTRRQLTVDFEEELKQLDPLAKFNEREKAKNQQNAENSNQNQPNAQQHQSVIPKPTNIPNVYIKDGIIVW
jgi:hypothetical protein